MLYLNIKKFVFLLKRIGVKMNEDLKVNLSGLFWDYLDVGVAENVLAVVFF